jgi:hypothetical protein
VSANHPSGIFIPDENSTPFTLDLLESSKLTIKVGSWVEGEGVGEDLLLLPQKKHGAWLLKAKYKSKNAQVLDDLCFVRRYFRQNKWGSILAVDNHGGGSIIYLYPPRKEEGEEVGND